VRFAVLVLGAALVSWPAAAAAQTGLRPYVGASLGVFSVDADEVDGSSTAIGVQAGVAWSRYADVELEAVIPRATFARSGTALLVSFAPPGSSREEIERLGVVARIDRARDVAVNLAVVVVVRPPPGRRVRPGALVGFFSQRVEARTVITPVTIGPGVDPQHPAVIAREERTAPNVGGLTFGANLALAVSPHLELVPDVRYDYGSLGDEINNAWRASARVVWRF
jgi:hypothetical protein